MLPFLNLHKWDMPDARFYSDNEYDIPVLDLEWQAGPFVHTPARVWGSIKRNQVMHGTYLFYTQDYRFTALCDNPAPIVNSECHCAVEPNFTTSEQMETGLVIAATLAKRKIACWWQTFGIRIWVDLYVAPNFAELNLVGVPAGWRAFFTRGHVERLDGLDAEYELACWKRGSRDVWFAVYGGGMAVKTHCQKKGYLWVPECMDVRKGKAQDA